MNKERVLLNVSYIDNTGKFWCDSYIKNKIYTLLDNNIHKTIAEAVKETDGIILSYNAKPQQNVFIDDKDGNAKAIGYIYRGRNEIYNDESGKYEKALFGVWVDVKSVSDYPIIDIE